MKRFFLLAFSFGLFTATAQSQIAKVWQAELDAPGSPVQQPQRLLATPDGGVISIRSVESLDGTTRTVSAAKWSENGEFEWEFSRAAGVSLSVWYWGQGDGGVDAAGNLYLVYAGRLVKLDPAGSVLWEVGVMAPNLIPFATSHLVLDSGDLPVVVGTVDRGTFPYISLYKYDAAGNQIWAKGGTVEGAAYEIAVGPSDEIVVFGVQDWFFGGSAYYGTVARFDANGNWAWNTRHSSDGYGTICCGTFWGDHVTDGAIDAQGNVYALVNGSFGAEWFQDGWVGFAVGAWNATGQALYRTSVSSPKATKGHQLTIDANRNVYIAGMEKLTETGNDPRFALWKLDPAGNLAWEEHFGVNEVGNSAGMGLKAMPSGNVLATGHRDGGVSAGFDILYSPMGVELWRADHEGTMGPTLYTTFSRDGILIDHQGHAYTHSVDNRTMVISKIVPGAAVGVPYCGPAVPNSTGQSGEIMAFGESVAANQNLTLNLQALPPGDFAMLLTSQTQGFVPMLGGGNGNLCLGGAIGRFNRLPDIRLIQPDGTSSFRVDLNDVPTPMGPTSVMAGQTWNFQAWFRDFNAGQQSNLTDGVSVTF